MLQIVPVDDFFTGGKQFVQFNYSGFDLKVLEDFPALGQFNVKTFAVFSKNGTIAMAYDPVNDFLEKCSLNRQCQIAEAFLTMSGIIKAEQDAKNALIKSPEEIMTTCGEVLDALDREIDLCQAIEDYIRAGNIFIPDMSLAGSRPHDREDMTFVQEEAIIVTAIYIVGKLCSPITGDYIYRYSAYIDSRSKERYAAILYKALLERKYSAIIDKLDHYIRNLTINKSRNDPNIHFKMFTPEFTAEYIKALLLVKKSVSIDLSRPDGNVIKYSASCIKSCTDSQQKGTNANMVRTFDDPKDDSDGAAGIVAEDSNHSRLEIESRPSHRPVDCIPIVKMASNHAAKTLIAQHGLDEYDIQGSIAWYKDNPPAITPIVLYAIASYAGPLMCGGQSALLNDPQTTIKLAAVLQMIAIKDGCPVFGHAMTLATGIAVRRSSAEDFKFMNGWRSSIEYAECKRVIDSAFGLVSWDDKIKDIASLLISQNYIIHMSPQAAELCKPEFRLQNGVLFTEHLTFMLDLMVFIRQLWTKRSEISVSNDA